MSDSSNETGAPAEKRVRKARTPKTPTADTAAAPTEHASDPAPQLPLPPVATERAPAPAAPGAPAAPAPSQDGGGDGPAPQAQGGGQHEGGDQRDGNRFNNNRRDRFRNRRERNRERQGNDGMPQDGNGSGQDTFVPRAMPNVPEGFPQYSLGDLKRMPAPKLLDIAEQLNIQEGVARARKQDVIFALLKVLTRHGEGVAADGVLEILPDGFGFLRAAVASFLAGPDDF